MHTSVTSSAKPTKTSILREIITRLKFAEKLSAHCTSALLLIPLSHFFFPKAIPSTSPCWRCQQAATFPSFCAWCCGPDHLLLASMLSLVAGLMLLHPWFHCPFTYCLTTESLGKRADLLKNPRLQSITSNQHCTELETWGESLEVSSPSASHCNAVLLLAALWFSTEKVVQIFLCAESQPVPPAHSRSCGWGRTFLHALHRAQGTQVSHCCNSWYPALIDVNNSFPKFLTNNNSLHYIIFFSFLSLLLSSSSYCKWIGSLKTSDNELLSSVCPWNLTFVHMNIHQDEIKHWTSKFFGWKRVC